MKVEIDHRKLAEMQDKLNRHEQHDALLTRLVAFEAAMRVLQRHKLIEEFAKEFEALK
jgi:hypothetical protein